ncbi:MAG: lysophospholipid acyltransferase family protein [Candidatus Kapaibacteriales bacterium]
MDKVNIKSLIEEKNPKLLSKMPGFASKGIVSMLEKVFHQRDINSFLDKAEGLEGNDFIDALFDDLDFNYYLGARDKKRIPAQGRLVIVANHPLGGLDGLAILRAVSEVRSDVRIVANDLLMNLDPLKEKFLPVDLYSERAQKKNMIEIMRALKNEEAVIFFPSGEVSRVVGRKIMDRKWNKGCITLAKNTESPILPIHIGGKNSSLFYGASFLKKEFATFMLAHEIFAKKGGIIKFTVGNPIPPSSFVDNVSTSYHAKMLRSHTYQIAEGKKGIFKTEKTIIHPVDKQSLKRELSLTEELGETTDGKKIFLMDYNTSPMIMKEISRLREITFRKVGEGTGYSFDSDMFDKYYKHIVLWDDKDLEIVGSYRLVVVKDMLKSRTKDALYNSHLYILHNKFDEYLIDAVEAGRSFIQQKYWGTAALDYLWQGIGAFLRTRPDIRYLFGAVSISSNYPADAQAIILEYYKKWYLGDTDLVTPSTPIELPVSSVQYGKSVLTGSDYTEDFRLMKNALRNFGLTVPTLLRRYTELCEYGGVKYLGFNRDGNFNNSLDCLALVDLHQMKPELRKRYYESQRSLGKKDDRKSFASDLKPVAETSELN